MYMYVSIVTTTCCWQVGSAPFVRCRCDCLAISAPFTNIQTYLLASSSVAGSRTRDFAVSNLLLPLLLQSADSAVCRLYQTHLALQDFNTHQTPALQCVHTASVSLWSRNVVDNQRHREKDQRPRSVVSSVHTEHYVVRACNKLRSP